MRWEGARLAGHLVLVVAMETARLAKCNLLGPIPSVISATVLCDCNYAHTLPKIATFHSPLQVVSDSRSRGEEVTLSAMNSLAIPRSGRPVPLSGPEAS